MMISGSVVYAALVDGLPVSRGFCRWTRPQRHAGRTRGDTGRDAAATTATASRATAGRPSASAAPGSPGTTEEEPKLLSERYSEPPPELPWSLGGAASWRPAWTGISYWLACGVPGDGSAVWAAAADGKQQQARGGEREGPAGSSGCRSGANHL